MNTWFEVSIKYEKIAENGKQKRITDKILVDALSYTECEARVIEEMTPFISGEFTVSDIKRANYSELFPSEEEAADRWFKCKLVFITLDEKSGAEKRTSTMVLVQAADLRDAVKKLDEGMKGTMADYIISSVSETPLMDVYPYSERADHIDSIDEAANSPVVSHFITSLPDNCRTSITVAGKAVIIDKTGRNTRVIPNNSEEIPKGKKKPGAKGSGKAKEK